MSPFFLQKSPLFLQMSPFFLQNGQNSKCHHFGIPPVGLPIKMAAYIWNLIQTRQQLTKIQFSAKIKELKWSFEQENITETTKGPKRKALFYINGKFDTATQKFVSRV